MQETAIINAFGPLKGFLGSHDTALVGDADGMKIRTYRLTAVRPPISFRTSGFTDSQHALGKQSLH